MMDLEFHLEKKSLCVGGRVIDKSFGGFGRIEVV